MDRRRKRSGTRACSRGDEETGQAWLDRNSFESSCGGSCRRRLRGRINKRPLFGEAARKATNEARL